MLMKISEVTIKKHALQWSSHQTWVAVVSPATLSRDEQRHSSAIRGTRGLASRIIIGVIPSASLL